MKTRVALLISLAAGACMGREPAGDDVAPAGDGVAPARQALERSDEGVTLQSCRALMQRQRACGAELIPALVDARVERDNPPGIAARDRQIGRDALLREAFEEWAVDSRDTAIDALCAEIESTISPAREAELLARTRACLDQTGCAELVACAVPLSLERWKE